MDLLKSVVFAAIISGVVGLIVAWISARTALKINKDKIRLDRQLAERRDIAERQNLTRKFDLERQAALIQKKAELAEKVLHDFYQISFTFKLIRSPMVWARLRTHSQKSTVAARAMAERKTFGHRS